MQQILGGYRALPVRARAVVLILCAVFVFSLIDAMAKFLTRHYAVPQVVWIRYVVHALLMLVVLAPRMGWRLVKTGRPFGQTLRAGLLMGSTLCNFGALSVLPLADVKAVSFVSPLLVCVLAAWLLKEKVGWNRWIAVLAGFCGVLFILRPGSGALSWAATLALGTAGCFSLYQIMTRRISDEEDPLVTLFFTALVGSVVLAFVAPWFWRPVAWAHVPLLLLLGAAGAGGHFLLIKAMEIEEASALSPYGYCQLIWVTLWGLLFFGQWPDGHTLIGMAIIAGSGLYVAYGHRSRRHEEPDSTME